MMVITVSENVYKNTNEIIERVSLLSVSIALIGKQSINSITISSMKKIINEEKNENSFNCFEFHFKVFIVAKIKNLVDFHLRPYDIYILP